jgi:acyl carrier protein
MPEIQGQARKPAPDAAQALLDTVHSIVTDLQQQDIDRLRITLDSRLQQDLGLDSLARVELFARVERDFGVQLPESLFASAETIGDILAVLNVRPAPSIRPAKTPATQSSAHADQTQPIIAPRGVETLDEVLAWHVEAHPDAVHITVCRDGADERITYARLWDHARAVAGGLQQQGIRAGEPIALMLPTDVDYFYAFMGVLLAGGIPVPLYPPARLNQIEEHVRRHTGILENSAAPILITTHEMRSMALMLRGRTRTLRRTTTTEELLAAGAAPTPPASTADSLALLQYTSGSTGRPKGVMLSHANLLANIESLGRTGKVASTDVFVSWLPLYHDMGLIGAWLSMLYYGLPLVVMSPLSFLTRPVRWLQAIDRYRGTLSAAPNFAYELCLKRITDEALADLSLASWRLALNGAEAVMPATVVRFQERFARYGLRPEAVTPVYGLAECTVGLAFPPLDRGPLIDVIEREPFMRVGAAVPASANATKPLGFVSCGMPISGHRLRVVDASGCELPERREGRLEFQGPSATRGYFRNPEATARLLRGDWLDSGDRAYIAAGELYITGRVKDIIIRAGRQIYPDELEGAVGTINGIRKGCVAVFGASDRSSGTERVVVLAETPTKDAARQDELRRQIVQCIVALIGEPPDDVVLAAPHTVLKTSSGKVRRAANRELYESQQHRPALPRPAWQQLLRLSLGTIEPAAWRAWRQLVEHGYAAWFWGVVVAFLVLAYVLLLLPVDASRRWSIGHWIARSILGVAGVPFSVVGADNLQAPGQHVIVANHSSYLDGIVLVAASSRPCRFVAKRELEHTPLVRTVLRRLDTVFVERFDPLAGAADARRLARMAHEGHSLIFFPEGTFTRAPGLLPFHLGAFATAAQCELPVIPVAIRGTRSVLRDEQWLPRRVAIEVDVGSPIPATSSRNVFAGAVQLREAARRSIRQLCGEPEL